MLNKTKALAIISAFLTLVACSDSVSDSASSEAAVSPTTHELAVERMHRNLDILRKELPRVLDDYITLETIDFDGSTVNFNHRLKLSNLNETQRNTIQSFMDSEHTKIACAKPETLVGLNMGFDYQYNYYDLDNITVGSFSMTKEICGNL